MGYTESALNNLLGRDVLDLIDQLRSLGIQNELPLPRIIVVGNQSSGKSSVLEAISRLPFPRGEGLCTLFATELILRNVPTESIKASIVASDDPNRAPEQHEEVSKWRGGLTQLHGFESVVNNAKDVIRYCSSQGDYSYSRDVLRIEASGPCYPQLTLVDLPGIIASENKGQTQQDIKEVESIVRSYMSDESSIILCVLSAESERANQAALSLTQEYDPRGQRTIGVITKPDRAESDSAREKEMLAIADNQEYKLKHGWFVLKNRNFREGNLVSQERDEQEEMFFKSSKWQSLEHAGLGAPKLQAQLAKVLELEIRKELPSILDTIQSSLANYQSQRSAFGEPRATSRDQMYHLDRVAGRFEKIVDLAISGVYSHSFFKNKDGQRKLRSTMQDLTDGFAIDFYENGRTWDVSDKYNESGPLRIKSSTGPKQISRHKFIEMMKTRDLAERGLELPGMVNHSRLVADLFREQSEKWHSIARKYLDKVHVEVAGHLNIVCDYIDPTTELASKIQQFLIVPQLNDKYHTMLAKLDELVAPYQSWHPIVLDGFYNTTVFGTNANRLKVIPANAQFQNAHAMQQYELALDEMEAYYTLASMNFATNVAVLAAEMIMIKDLDQIFTPSTVMRMDADMLERLAAESDEVQEQRSDLDQKIAKLKQAQDICNEYFVIAHRRKYVEPRPVTPELVFSDDTLSPLPLRSPSTPRDALHYSVSPGSKGKKPAPLTESSADLLSSVSVANIRSITSA